MALSNGSLPLVRSLFIVSRHSALDASENKRTRWLCLEQDIEETKKHPVTPATGETADSVPVSAGHLTLIVTL